MSRDKIHEIDHRFVTAEIFPQKEWGKAMSLYGFAFVIAPILGPVIGGWLTENWSWPWIFFINIPFGCLAAFLSHNLLFSRGISELIGHQLHMGLLKLINFIYSLQL